MDVSALVDAQASKYKTTQVHKDIPLDVDVGLLTVTDTNAIDEESYAANIEEYLLETARDGVQVLVTSLFALPTKPSPDGPLAVLPPATTQLPRTKPLPKPKPPTKWERFAAAKGIQKIRRERRVFDEEKQEWVNRWGKGAKNKELEEQWLTEVPSNAPVDYDAAKEARDARKARVAENEKQKEQNLARAHTASGRGQRKREIEHTLATTRISTASMGRFDKKLEGEPKLKGQKRKFEPSEMSSVAESKRALDIISKLDGPTSKKPKQDGAGRADVVNVRKAVRYASKGRGGVALAGSLDSKERRSKGKTANGQKGKRR